jgi:hypothetical protein
METDVTIEEMKENERRGAEVRQRIGRGDDEEPANEGDDQ